MHTGPTIEELKKQLAQAQQAQAQYDAQATEAYALAAEQQPGVNHSSYVSYAVRCRGQAMVWGRRVGELLCEIKAIEQPATAASRFELSAAQLAAVDDTAGLCGVAA